MLSLNSKSYFLWMYFFPGLRVTEYKFVIIAICIHNDSLLVRKRRSEPIQRCHQFDYYGYLLGSFFYLSPKQVCWLHHKTDFNVLLWPIIVYKGNKRIIAELPASLGIVFRNFVAKNSNIVHTVKRLVHKGVIPGNLRDCQTN